MTAALRVEALKLTRSLVGVVATLAVVAGTVALLAGITAGVVAGDPGLTAKAGPAATLDWDGLLAGAAQVTAVAGLLGPGVVLAWMVGREFADGTITGLFALPVGRGRLAAAKLVVYEAWVLAVAVALCLAVLLLGLGLGYGAPSAQTWQGLGRLGSLAVLSAALALPVAWVTTLTRSLLAGVGTTIGLVVMAQVGALVGAGAWMPFAAPALWAMSEGTAAGPVQLALVVGVATVSAGLTCLSWRRLQLDR